MEFTFTPILFGGVGCGLGRGNGRAVPPPGGNCAICVGDGVKSVPGGVEEFGRPFHQVALFPIGPNFGSFSPGSRGGPPFKGTLLNRIQRHTMPVFWLVTAGLISKATVKI